MSRATREEPTPVLIGEEVEYYSTSASQWIPARVQGYNVDGTFELDVKKSAQRINVRRKGASAGIEIARNGPQSIRTKAKDTVAQVGCFLIKEYIPIFHFYSVTIRWSQANVQAPQTRTVPWRYLACESQWIRPSFHRPPSAALETEPEAARPRPSFGSSCTKPKQKHCSTFGARRRRSGRRRQGGSCLPWRSDASPGRRRRVRRCVPRQNSPFGSAVCRLPSWTQQQPEQARTARLRCSAPHRSAGVPTRRRARTSAQGPKRNARPPAQRTPALAQA